MDLNKEHTVLKKKNNQLTIPNSENSKRKTNSPRSEDSKFDGKAIGPDGV